MKLKIVGSGSQGNCYILHNYEESLMIEAGGPQVRFQKIKQAMNFNFSKLAGCLITHNHSDHGFCAADLLRLGVKVYATEETHKALETYPHHNAIPINKKTTFKVGGFSVTAFDVRHDAADPVGFFIQHPDCGNVLFLTDTFVCEYTFPQLNNIIIEANYSQKIIDEKLKADKCFLRDRVLENHMEISTTLGVLRANNLSLVNNIVLIHLSDSNSNAAEFKMLVENTTGKNVTIALPGVEIPFYKTPF